MNYFSYSAAGDFNFSADDISGDVDYKIKLRNQSESLALDFYPSRKGTFHISAGALFDQSEYAIDMKPTGATVEIGDNSYDVDPGGKIKLKITRPDICPFVTIGGNFFTSRKKHWGVGFEVGASYGKWNVDLKSKNIVDTPGDTLNTDIKNTRDDIRDVLNKFPVWPILKLNVSYAF